MKKINRITDEQINKIIPHLDISCHNDIYTATWDDEDLYVSLSFDVKSEMIIKSEAYIFEGSVDLHTIQENIIIEAIKRNIDFVNDELKEVKLVQEEYYNEIGINSYYVV